MQVKHVFRERLKAKCVIGLIFTISVNNKPIFDFRKQTIYIPSEYILFWCKTEYCIYHTLTKSSMNTLNNLSDFEQT